GRHEMLPVPHADDDREVGFDLPVKILGLEHEAVRPPRERQKLGREEAQRVLNEGRLRQAPGGQQTVRSPLESFPPKLFRLLCSILSILSMTFPVKSATFRVIFLP